MQFLKKRDNIFIFFINYITFFKSPKFKTMDNCIQTVYCVLKLLKVKFTSEYVEYYVWSQPQQLRVISILDILEKFNIQTTNQA